MNFHNFPITLARGPYQNVTLDKGLGNTAQVAELAQFTDARRVDLAQVPRLTSRQRLKSVAPWTMYVTNQIDDNLPEGGLATCARNSFISG